MSDRKHADSVEKRGIARKRLLTGRAIASFWLNDAFVVAFFTVVCYNIKKEK